MGLLAAQAYAARSGRVVILACPLSNASKAAADRARVLGLLHCDNVGSPSAFQLLQFLLGLCTPVSLLV